MWYKHAVLLDDLQRRRLCLIHNKVEIQGWRNVNVPPPLLLDPLAYCFDSRCAAKGSASVDLAAVSRSVDVTRGGGGFATSTSRPDSITSLILERKTSCRSFRTSSGISSTSASFRAGSIMRRIPAR